MENLEKEKLLEEIIEKFDLQKGQYIDYEFFLNMYEKVKDKMTEEEFSDLLGMTDSKYRKIKNYNANASILKNMGLDKEQQKELLEDLVKQYDLQKGQIISYEETNEEIAITFKQLYRDYKSKFTEYEFANLLGINNENFRKFCKGKSNAKVLMIELTEEEKNQILEEIIIKFDLAKEQLIPYRKEKDEETSFKEIYETVKVKLTENELADLLDITQARLDNIRKKGQTPILKNRKYFKEDKTLLFELIENYNFYKEQKIDYTAEKDENEEYKELCFYQIYEPYKSYFTEKEMAILLGGTEQTYYKMKLQNIPFKLLRKTTMLEDITEGYKKEIKEIVDEKEGKGIEYEEFKEIYEKYKLCITESELALLLGISIDMLGRMRKAVYKPVIKDYDVYEKCKSLKKTMENRWYSLEEIQKICKENSLEVEQFVKYIMHYRIKYIKGNLYLEALYKNNGLQIGHISMSNEFISKNYEEMNRIANLVTHKLLIKYNKRMVRDDLESVAMEYIIFECGDIAINFKYDLEKVTRLIYTRTRKYLNGIIIKNSDENYKTRLISIEDVFEFGSEVKKRKKFVDKYKYTVDDKEIEQIIERESKTEKNQTEKIINLFKQSLLQGYDKESIIENISKTFKIEKEEMLEMMKNYLLENKRVVQNKNGEYEIGEQ